MPEESLDGRLRRYEEEIEQLRLENEHLRMSAMMFGDLAERLSRALRERAERERMPLRRRG